MGSWVQCPLSARPFALVLNDKICCSMCIFCVPDVFLDLYLGTVHTTCIVLSSIDWPFRIQPKNTCYKSHGKNTIARDSIKSSRYCVDEFGIPVLVCIRVHVGRLSMNVIQSAVRYVENVLWSRGLSKYYSEYADSRKQSETPPIHSLILIL